MNDAPLHSEALDRFLDGAMSPAEAAAFEAQLASSPELMAEFRAEQALQQQLNNSLRASFAPPAMPPLLTQTEQLAEEQASFPIKKTRSWSREAKLLLALAAAIALIVGVQSYSWLTTPGVPERPTLVATYEKIVDSGFRPSEVCTTPESFSKWTAARYSTPLTSVEKRPSVEFVGWSYSTAISNYTGVLLARVDGKPVIVVLDTIANRDTVGSPCWRSPQDDKVVNIFPMEIGSLILYEITPFDAPRIVDNLAAVASPTPK